MSNVNVTETRIFTIKEEDIKIWQERLRKLNMCMSQADDELKELSKELMQDNLEEKKEGKKSARNKEISKIIDVVRDTYNDKFIEIESNDLEDIIKLNEWKRVKYFIRWLSLYTKTACLRGYNSKQSQHFNYGNDVMLVSYTNTYNNIIEYMINSLQLPLKILNSKRFWRKFEKTFYKQTQLCKYKVKIVMIYEHVMCFDERPKLHISYYWLGDESSIDE